MSDTLKTLIETAMKKTPPAPLFSVGQTVRIRSTLSVNIHAIRDMLGRKGTVESVNATCLSRRNIYNVRVGNRVEPFEFDELDARFTKRTRRSPS